jgi:hypothetical protein
LSASERFDEGKRIKNSKEKTRNRENMTNLVTRVADDETFVSDSWTSICLFSYFIVSFPYLFSVFYFYLFQTIPAAVSLAKSLRSTARGWDSLA